MDKVIAEKPPKVEINVDGAKIIEQETQSYGYPIEFPQQTEVISRIAIDIGGSLSKVVYVTNDEKCKGIKLRFERFETSQILKCLDFVKALIDAHKLIDSKDSDNNNICVMATGGGGYKFYEIMKSKLNVEIFIEDEMDCLIKGIQRQVFNIIDQKPTFVDLDDDTDFLPYILVNIGSGVSIIKVDKDGQHERIGGSSLGGGTLWGLLSKLTNAVSFDEMLSLSQNGDNSAVDMLIGDIYGSNHDYNKIGLKNNAIASTFGKLSRRKSATIQARSNDMSKSLLYGISNNIAQIAYLHAQRFDIKNIFFGGSFIRNHMETMLTLSFGTQFWSKNTYKAYFLRHEGYLGAVGAFLKHKPPIWQSTINRKSSVIN